MPALKPRIIAGGMTSAMKTDGGLVRWVCSSSQAPGEGGTKDEVGLKPDTLLQEIPERSFLHTQTNVLAIDHLLTLPITTCREQNQDHVPL